MREHLLYNRSYVTCQSFHILAYLARKKESTVLMCKYFL